MNTRDNKIIENKPYFLTEEESYKYCDDTKTLANGLKTGFMMLAERLHRISKQKLYKPVYDHFYEYCNEIDMREDTASRLVSIYEKFILQYQLPIEEIKEIDYTKLYLIKKVSETKETAEHWVEEAKVLTYRDLQKRVKEVTSGVEQMTCPHGNTYLIRCCRDCGETWEEFGGETVTVHKDALKNVLLEARENITSEMENEDFMQGFEWVEKALINNLKL